MMAIRLKVNVSTLLAKAEEKQAELERELEAELDGYEAARRDYLGEARRYAVTEFEAMAREGEVWDIFGRYYSARGDDRPSPPRFPTKPNNERAIAQVKRDIGLLKASSQETVTIGTDSDLARYL